VCAYCTALLFLGGVSSIKLRDIHESLLCLQVLPVLAESESDTSAGFGSIAELVDVDNLVDAYPEGITFEVLEEEAKTVLDSD
jgi:hypothetical protein